MARALQTCSEPRCPELVTRGTCPRHRAPARPWTTNRSARLPSDWERRRLRILTRDNRTCYLCGGHATEVDHVTAGDNHDDTNLAAICEPCHRRKSSREGNLAKKRMRSTA